METLQAIQRNVEQPSRKSTATDDLQPVLQDAETLTAIDISSANLKNLNDAKLFVTVSLKLYHQLNSSSNLSSVRDPLCSKPRDRAAALVVKLKTQTARVLYNFDLIEQFLSLEGGHCMIPTVEEYWKLIGSGLGAAEHKAVLAAATDTTGRQPGTTSALSGRPHTAATPSPPSTGSSTPRSKSHSRRLSTSSAQSGRFDTALTSLTPDADSRVPMEELRGRKRKQSLPANSWDTISSDTYGTNSRALTPASSRSGSRRGSTTGTNELPGVESLFTTLDIGNERPIGNGSPSRRPSSSAHERYSRITTSRSRSPRSGLGPGPRLPYRTREHYRNITTD